MNYNPQRHIRQQALYCPHCGKDTEQGVWVQSIPQLNKSRDYADCLECENTGSVAEKQAARK